MPSCRGDGESHRGPGSLASAACLAPFGERLVVVITTPSANRVVDKAGKPTWSGEFGKPARAISARRLRVSALTPATPGPGFVERIMSQRYFPNIPSAAGSEASWPALADGRRSARRGSGSVRRAARRAAADSGADGLRRRSALADGRRRPGQRHPFCWCGSRRKGSTVSAPARTPGACWRTQKTGSRR
jgi:hypothetical protein